MNDFTGTESSDWVTFLVKQPQPKLRLFCFPFAGGGSSAFNDLKGIMPADTELAVMELPGRGRRFHEALIDDMAEIVGQMANAFVNHIDVPYVFFGHSLGALIAMELLQTLRQRGAPMPLFFISSGMRAPQFPARERLHALDDAAFLAALKRYNGTPAGLIDNPELMALFLPVLRADFSLSENHHDQPYQTRRPFDFPLYVMTGDEDHSVTKAELDGWKIHTNNHFEQKCFPGDHFYWQSHSKTAVLADLSLMLDQTLAGVVIPEPLGMAQT